MLASNKTRDAIHANFSVTRKCHVSCHEGGVSRRSSNTTKSILLSPPPRLPSTLPRGAAVSFRVLRPAYRRRGFVGTTRRAVRVAHRRVHRYRASASPRVAARVEFVRPEEEPIGSSEGGYSDATRDVRILTIVHVDQREGRGSAHAISTMRSAEASRPAALPATYGNPVVAPSSPQAQQNEDETENSSSSPGVKNERLRLKYRGRRCPRWRLRGGDASSASS